MNVLDYYGPPVSAGQYHGQPIELVMPAEERTGQGQFCAFVIIGQSKR
jgi:hypothetical protein